VSEEDLPPPLDPTLFQFFKI